MIEMLYNPFCYYSIFLIKFHMHLKMSLFFTAFHDFLITFIAY